MNEITPKSSLCACAPCVSLRRELVTIFGVPTTRGGDAWKPDNGDGEKWNDAMLRRIGNVLSGNLRQAEYVQRLHESVTGPLALLVQELKGE
jgi:hypothetical protein